MKPVDYVLITPARNEAEYIGLTLESVAAQAHKPLKWVIVSDGSTDGTDELVAKYAAEHNWIDLIRMPERKERHFAGKVLAFNAGCEAVRELPYEVIGNLDGDVSFDEGYFSFLMEQFATNPQLGVAGTPFTEGGAQYDYRFTSIEHVSGQVQMFRRKCFEQFGGYVPARLGGIDHVAVIKARMHGWQTRTFTEKRFVHHRVMGTAGHGAVRAKWKVGKLDYALGGHPLWELFRGIYQMSKRPFIIGGIMILAGYTWSMLKRTERPVSHELVQFRHREQMARLKARFLPGRKQAGISK